MKTNKSKINFRELLFLHLVLLLYSLCSVSSKNAAMHDFLSSNWILWYGASLAGLFCYALLWQQVIKHMPLTVAYANKSIVIIWGIIWSAFIFQETITPTMLIGAAIIMLGIYFVGVSNE